MKQGFSSSRDPSRGHQERLTGPCPSTPHGSVAEFSQHRNDLYWKLWAGEDGFIRWTGYDDAFWWDRVSKTDAARKRVGEVTGRHFVLNHDTGRVTTFDPPGKA